MIGRSRVGIPAKAAGEFSSQGGGGDSSVVRAPDS